jgi:hypothetical protein
LALLPSAGWADSVSSVENARAKERQGRWLNSEDREQLRRWGGNDDGRYDGYVPYSYGYYDYGPRYRYYRYPH